MLAERMRARHGIPWFPLDALKMGLHLGAPAFGVHPDEDDLETADRMWPVVKGVIEHFLFDGRDYLLEGVNLRPRTVADFIARLNEPVKVCFLGYPGIQIDDKIAQVGRYTGLPNDWLNRTGPDNVRRYLEISRSLSGHLRDDCATCGLPFVDTGPDFYAGLQLAEQVLIGGSTSSAEGMR